MLLKETRNRVINKLTTHFIDSPKLNKNNSIDTEDNQGNKFYYLYCDNIKDPGISFDEILEAYPENSKLIQ
ncbi:16895_t:CDS:2, partial [Racocetra fulgida]